MRAALDIEAKDMVVTKTQSVTKQICVTNSMNRTRKTRSGHPFRSTIMNALSRREEDNLLKATKSYALKKCDPVVKGTFCNLSPNLHAFDTLHRIC